MKLSDFFRRAGTKNIVINSDLDGFLSGMILQQYYECKIVGFTNSKESIWLDPDIVSINTPVYIDIFINTPDVYCIDQHIVAYDNAHLERLLAYGTKLNPNLDISRRTYSGDLGESSDYYKKYPFGTIHYLLALMKEDGFELECNPLNQEYTVEGYITCPGQILLRADDALYSSLGRFEGNTKIWWNFLSKYQSRTIDRLIKYKDSCDKKRNKDYKEKIGQMFKNGLDCDGNDGAFDSILDLDGKTIKTEVLHYNEVIADIMGIQKLDLPRKMVEHRGSAKREYYNEKILNDAFTYAFVGGPKKGTKTFSFTTDFE